MLYQGDLDGPSTDDAPAVITPIDNAEQNNEDKTVFARPKEQVDLDRTIVTPSSQGYRQELQRKAEEERKKS